MPSSISASSDGSQSPSSSQGDHLEVTQNGSRKRRRLSPGASDSDSDSESQSETETKQSDFQPKVPAIATLPTISRIKAKAKTSSATPGDGLSETIREAIKGNEKVGFADLNVDPWLVTSLRNMAIKNPTGIQKGCIPEILKGRDCIGGARTGSGKTVAFAAPILNALAKDPTGIFAVVLTPTRELALQLYEQFMAIGSPQSLKCLLVTGGSEMRTQAIKLSSRPHIVIATPGRLADHVKTSGEDTICGLRRVRYVVMDEADRLLSSGKGSMLPDVETCLEVLPPSSKRTTLLFTATVSPEVRALQDQKIPGKQSPFLCEVDTEDLAIPPTLKQTYQLVNVVHKEKYLHILLSTPENLEKTTIIFVNRTSTANLLEHMLRLLEHRVTSLHSALPQADRTNNLARFRANAARILIATDVAARGLDIKSVGLVINYDLPRNPDDYVHRVGRTARAGRSGVSISLVGQRDVSLVQAIEARVGKQMELYEEAGVNVETRVIKEALNVVGDRKREAVLAIEEGRDVRGKRRKGLGKIRGV